MDADTRLSISIHHVSLTSHRGTLLDDILLWGLMRYLDSYVPAVDQGLRKHQGSAVRAMGFIHDGYRPYQAFLLSWSRGDDRPVSRSKQWKIITRAGMAGVVTLLANLDQNPWVKAFFNKLSIRMDNILDWDRIVH